MAVVHGSPASLPAHLHLPDGGIIPKIKNGNTQKNNHSINHQKKPAISKSPAFKSN